MNDTHPDIEAQWHTRLMARSGAERLIMGAGMFSTSLILMRAGITATYGDLSEVDMREKLLHRLYGDEISPEARQQIAAHCSPSRS
ncbi:MAG: hypothetical protein V3U76_06535 [Granulosicoccus sp.]